MCLHDTSLLEMFFQAPKRRAAQSSCNNLREDPLERSHVVHRTSLRCRLTLERVRKLCRSSAGSEYLPRRGRVVRPVTLAVEIGKAVRVGRVGEIEDMESGNAE